MLKRTSPQGLLLSAATPTAPDRVSIFSSNIGPKPRRLAAPLYHGMAMAHGNAWLDHSGAGLGLVRSTTHKIFTMPEFLELRFSRRSRTSWICLPCSLVVDQDRRHHLRRLRRSATLAERASVNISTPNRRLLGLALGWPIHRLLHVCGMRVIM